MIGSPLSHVFVKLRVVIGLCVCDKHVNVRRIEVTGVTEQFVYSAVEFVVSPNAYQ